MRDNLPIGRYTLRKKLDYVLMGSCSFACGRRVCKFSCLCAGRVMNFRFQGANVKFD